MTKNEFMEKLSVELRTSQSGETAEGLLSDFNEHFDEALRAGQTEEAICEMLGDPAEIAAAYCDDIDRSEVPPDDAGIFISLSYMDLFCESCDEKEFYVEVRHNNKVVQDDTIQVKQTKSSFQVIQIREKDFIRRLFSAIRFRKVCVKIPSQFRGNMSVQMTSGNLRMDGVSIAGDMRCELLSGNIQMTKVCTDGALSISARSGNVALDHCTSDLSVESHSGNIKVMAHKGDVSRAVTTSGNLRMEVDHITKDCSFEAKSGNTHVDLGTLKASMNLYCHSGNIKFSVRELQGNITGKTRSGNITGFLGRNTRAAFLLQSSDIQNKFPNVVIPESSIPVVNLTSRSGNVRIKEL